MRKKNDDDAENSDDHAENSDDDAENNDDDDSTNNNINIYNREGIILTMVILTILTIYF
jgi:hypothetical protein